MGVVLRGRLRERDAVLASDYIGVSLYVVRKRMKSVCVYFEYFRRCTLERNVSYVNVEDISPR